MGSRVKASVVVVHGLSCSEACGIFPDQGSELLSPSLQGRLLTTGPPEKPTIILSCLSSDSIGLGYGHFFLKCPLVLMLVINSHIS